MATSFNDLPQELCNRIIQFFRYDRRTLLRLCLTSVRFVDEAQSFLYAKLTFNIMTSFKLILARASKLLSTLTVHNPSLAKYVKAFSYDIWLPEDHPGVYEKLRHAIRLMINVTWLEINTTIPHSPQGFFDGWTFQLKHFRCKFGSSDRKTIYKMLSTQLSLQSVYIDKFDHDFPSDCCLNIKRLCVEDWRSIEQILPGRSIVVLEILRLQESQLVELFNRSVPPSIKIQLGNLTHLTLKTNTFYTDLKTLAPYLTLLMILRIIGKDNQRYGVAKYAQNIAGKPEILCKLTNLKIFVWSLDVSLDSHRITEEEADELSDMLWELVELWFKEMPKLEEVYILKLDWEDPDNEDFYSHWIKGVGPTTVEAKTVLGRKSFYTR
ncbi:hypothetical protein AGABI1DRAFT_93283 [Agaricus bisporus var. burnettii JB137-S8]|uniref:F-box domain-containing protein n=1 Tax=Agaricus bisporus var. burnettii (strain JB137-S8 / ATCC MYA-4627 / FGSC 10392) TaxID=597362 RepID=K5VSX0_AGABU|nr:uncharacterized protein AGABI1DRAFT_93283 [Agaricus bisporus var. burnettii JB137-S8]EKM77554.1 hypothetical protein AGABI1DRAFT_93283 [Agaricus bisporus var. burnettii JB137-S8]